MLNDLVAKAAQGITRRVIDLDDNARALIEPLVGRVVEVQVQALGLTLFVIATVEGIVIRDEFDGAVDATVSGRPSQFAQVLTDGASAAAVRASGISIEGDLEVVEAFAAVAEALDPDVEEYVSSFVGDGAARKLGVAARRLSGWFNTTSKQFNEDMGFFLREDSGLLITEEQLAQYTDGVDALRADTDRLEQRIKRLQQSQES